MASELLVLGPPELRVAGRSVAVETRKALAVLAKVAIDGPQRRATLDVLLWPDSDGRRARQALRRTLTAIRRALGEDTLADGDDVAVTDLATPDLDRLQAVAAAAAADRENIEAALEGVRGSFLEGLDFADAEPFEHWRRSIALGVERQQATLLERLCRRQVLDDDLPGAVESATRRLGMDPLHEPSHRQLMVLHAWLGDRAQVDRAYDRCLQVLDEELGVAPVEQTVALHRALLAGRLPARPRGRTGSAGTGPAPPQRRPRGELPMVGRARELGRVLQLLEASAAGRVVVVRGEAGIGKTRFVGELGRARRERGSSVVQVTALDVEAGLAYAPVTTLLRALPAPTSLPEQVRREVARLAPEVAGTRPDPTPLTTVAARTRFVDSCVTAILEGLCPTGSDAAMLVVEDLDRADPDTQELVGYLARRIGDRPLDLVVSLRAAGAVRRDVVPHLGEDVAVVDLARLSLEDVRELARARGATEHAVRLFDESEGVPLLVVSYLAALEDGSDWQLPADGRRLVLARLDPLDEVARQVLAAAAVLGGAVTIEQLVATSGRGEEEVVEALEHLVDSGLLIELESGGEPAHRFTHDKIRAVVLEETSRTRLRLLHRRAAEALVTARTPVSAALLARHLEAAGLESQAADAHARAGRRAADLYANLVALEHVQAALALGHEDGAALLVQAGDLLVRLGRYGQAADHYHRAQARGAPRGEVARRLGRLALRQGDPALAVEHHGHALDVASDPVTSAAVRVELGLALLQRGDESQDDTAVAAGHAREALATARELGRAQVAARACNVAGLAARRLGDHDAAQRLLRDGIDLAIDPEDAAALRNNLALSLLEQGDAEAAVVEASRALEDGRRLGDRHREAALVNNLADALHATGRTQAAIDLQKEAAAGFAGIDDAPRVPEIWQLVEW